MQYTCNSNLSPDCGPKNFQIVQVLKNKEHYYKKQRILYSLVIYQYFYPVWKCSAVYPRLLAIFTQNGQFFSKHTHVSLLFMADWSI